MGRAYVRHEGEGVEMLSRLARFCEGMVSLPDTRSELLASRCQWHDAWRRPASKSKDFLFKIFLSKRSIEGGAPLCATERDANLAVAQPDAAEGVSEKMDRDITEGDDELLAAEFVPGGLLAADQAELARFWRWVTCRISEPAPPFRKNSIPARKKIARG